MYRLPFADEPGWSLNTGNHDDPIHGHDKGQYYAFDFLHPVGGHVLAARSGYVIFVENSVAINVSKLPDTDPNKGKFAGGNIVIIRHTDNTTAEYCHLEKGGISVKKDGWVAQGQFIGNSGDTGNSTAPHCHFDIRTYWNSWSDLGPMIPAIFEDKNHTAWRPKVGDSLASNNTVLLQETWSWCNKCQGLFYSGNPGSKCPTSGEHNNTGSGNYNLQINSQTAPGQQGWRWCHKCQGLFFGGNPGSKCPADGGEHDKTGSGNYSLVEGSNAPGQQGWRWCHKCQGLFFGGNPGSKCPADGGAHSKTGSGNYSLMQTVMNGVQGDWRHCTKCQGLFFGGNPGSKCPADDGVHSKIGSGNYYLGLNSPTYPGQQGWRWCHKCQGLFFGGNPGSKCPEDGGEHDKTGSGNYSLVEGSNAPGQQGWRWCHKCQGLFFGGNPGSKCPAGQGHSSTGSGKYGIIS